MRMQHIILISFKEIKFILFPGFLQFDCFTPLSIISINIVEYILKLKVVKYFFNIILAVGKLKTGFPEFSDGYRGR